MKKILVIEDMKSVCEQCVHILEKEGFQARPAFNGITGIEIAKEYLPDLIICDVILYDKNGFEVLKELRKDESVKLVPIIFISVSFERKIIREGMELGAADYLPKPFSAQELLATVKTQLEKQDNLKKQVNKQLSVLTKKALIKRLKIEELISSISNRFININPSGIGMEVKESFRKIAELLGNDRACMYIIDPDTFIITEIYEWIADNKKPDTHTIIGQSIKRFEFTYNKLKNLDDFYIPSVDEFSDEIKEEKIIWEKTGTKSGIAFPLGNNDYLTGFWGISYYKPYEISDREDINLMRILSDVFSNAIERKKRDDHIDYIIKMEELLTNISNRFLNSDTARLEKNIIKTIEAMGKFINADGGFVCLYTPDYSGFKDVYEWTGENVKPKTVYLENRKLNPYSWSLKCFKSFECISINDISNIPIEGKLEQELFQSAGYKSVLACPLNIRNISTGFISFYKEKEEKHWKKDEIRLLKMVSDIIASVLRRKKIVSSSKIHTTINHEERSQFYNMVGKSAKMQFIYNMIEDLSDVDSNVLITGESGTGKELVASAIHYKGIRRNKPMVKFNCTAITESIMESELFGYAKGAFTGALSNKQGLFQKAHGGTILLDEIGDISLNMQVKLLRAIQEKEIIPVGYAEAVKVDVRIIAATNQDLEKKIKNGLFRSDLFYRLRVIEIELPPLRERREDIPLLIDYFITKFNKKFNKNITDLGNDVKKLFLSYEWPGNIRELEHMLERAVATTSDHIINFDKLPLSITNYSIHVKGSDDEKQRILSAIDRTYGNKSKAAKLLNMGRTSFYKKLKDYGIN